jgi:hypothetical protein
MRLIAVAGPVKGSVVAMGAAGGAACFGIGLSIRLLAMVPPRTVMDAIVLIFIRAPRVAFNLTAIRCGADSGLTNVVKP